MAITSGINGIDPAYLGVAHVMMTLGGLPSLDREGALAVTIEKHMGHGDGEATEEVLNASKLILDTLKFLDKAEVLIVLEAVEMLIQEVEFPHGTRELSEEEEETPGPPAVVRVRPHTEVEADGAVVV